MSKTKIRRLADYDPETGKAIPRREALMIDALRKEVKELRDYIVNEAILKQREIMDGKK